MRLSGNDISFFENTSQARFSDLVRGDVITVEYADFGHVLTLGVLDVEPDGYDLGVSCVISDVSGAPADPDSDGLMEMWCDPDDRVALVGTFDADAHEAKSV